MDDKLQSQVVGEVNASFLSSQITSLRNTALPFTYNVPVVLYVLVRTSMYSLLVVPTLWYCATYYMLLHHAYTRTYAPVVHTYSGTYVQLLHTAMYVVEHEF